MTHDELLQKINSYTFCSGKHEIAFLEIAELHKPKINPTTWTVNEDGIRIEKIHCEGCSKVYPCKTIQYLEKAVA